MLYVTLCKVLRVLSNWREPLILSYMSCEISGNFKFSCGIVFNRQVVSDSFVIPWAVACQDPLSMGLPRQESWSGLPFLSPEDFLDLGVKPTCLLLDRQIVHH